jgi:hypothetical protein
LSYSPQVTPSSPSPDPNHPDYPEFFEGRLYQQHIRRPSRQSSRRSSGSSCTSEAQGDFNNLTLVLEEGATSDDCEEGDDNVEMLDAENGEIPPSPETQADLGQDDTPDIDEILAEAERSNLARPDSVPGGVIKILRQTASSDRPLRGKIHAII